MGKVPGHDSGSIGNTPRSAHKLVSGAEGGSAPEPAKAASSRAGSQNVKGGADTKSGNSDARAAGNTWEGGGNSGPQPRKSGAKG